MSTAQTAVPRVALVALAMVKNEQDIVEPFVRHHLRFLDRLYVLDNGSCDRTRAILGSLEAELPGLTVYDDLGFAYSQSQRMTALMQQVLGIAPAEFLLFLDADEFLECASRDELLGALRAIAPAACGRVFWKSFVPLPGSLDSLPHAFHDKLADHAGAGLPGSMVWRRAQEAHPTPKVILRTAGLDPMTLRVGQGNHFLLGPGGKQLETVDLAQPRLRHYPLRSTAQYVAKSVVGWMAYLALNPLSATQPLGAQWRDNCQRILREGPPTERMLAEEAYWYGVSPAQRTKEVDWERDLVCDPFPGDSSAGACERKYSTSESMDPLQLLALSWNLSLLSHSFASLAELEKSGKIAEVLSALHAAIAIHPHPALMMRAADLEARRGRLDCAEPLLRRVLALAPRNRNAAVSLALVLLGSGRAEEAEPLLRPHEATLAADEATAVAMLRERAASAVRQPCAVAEAPRLQVLSEHFQRLEAPEACRQIFRQTVQYIEVEIHSYCNRECAFCGNSLIDRRSHKTLMDPALYTRIVDELATIDYAGVLWYSRYNEPCSDRSLFLARLTEARGKLPRARLQTFTNGDYITADYIAALRDAGLNRLSIMTYLGPGVEPTEANFTRAMHERVARLGLPWRQVRSNQIQLLVEGIDATYNFDNFLKVGTNRGGALQSGCIIDRQSPCTVSFTDLYIDHNGCMVPCCDIRSDFAPHKDLVVYTLTPETSLFTAYANSPLVEWRRSLARFGAKGFPCNSCSRRTYADTPENRKMFEALASRIDQTPLHASAMHG